MSVVSDAQTATLEDAVPVEQQHDEEEEGHEAAASDQDDFEDAKADDDASTSSRPGSGIVADERFASDRLAAMSPEQITASASNDEAALDADLSGSALGDWVDPDVSGFSAASSQGADRTVR